MAKFASCFDITPNRCTVLEVFDTEEAALAACEGQNEIRVFEIAEDDDGPVNPLVPPGVRAFHGSDGKVWVWA